MRGEEESIAEALPGFSGSASGKMRLHAGGPRSANAPPATTSTRYRKMGLQNRGVERESRNEPILVVDKKSYEKYRMNT